MEGVLRVRKDVELDRETIAFYNLTICARDRGIPPLSSTVSLGAPFCWLYLTAPELSIETPVNTGTPKPTKATSCWGASPGPWSPSQT